MSNASVYDLKSVKLPYFFGFLLKQFVNLIEGPLSGLVVPQLLDSAGISGFRKLQFDDSPIVHPLAYNGMLHSKGQDKKRIIPDFIKIKCPDRQDDFRFETIQDFSTAYREGSITPLQVAENVINAITASNTNSPSLYAIIASYTDDLLDQARVSTERYKRGDILSPLDGVPIAVKDEFDMVPYPTTVGTKFLGDKPAQIDATIVSRLRSAGALLIGKANMHEVGIGVTGFNAHHGTVRNPYNPGHYTGGSSSGPAAAVAAGLCPAALGADGGGSIRIPAAFCGVIGLKPTFGRVSEFGAAPLTWSLAHCGPIGAHTVDVAIIYAAIAGPDPKDKMSWHQREPEYHGWESRSVEGMKLGVFWPWFRHASPDVVAMCEEMLQKYESLGAIIEEVIIPDLEAARVAHTITIAGEIAQSMEQYSEKHYKDFSLEVRTNLTLARALTASDFILSQRVRARTINHFNNALSKVDVILTPSTGIVAPPIPPKALPDGESDLTTLIEIMRFATTPNLTGLPAISFPVGYTEHGLPVGMQAIGRAWDEVSLLKIAGAAEKFVVRQKPQVYYQLLRS